MHDNLINSAIDVDARLVIQNPEVLVVQPYD